MEQQDQGNLTARADQAPTARCKRQPYWHPAFPTPDGRRYCAIERKDALGLLRQHRATKTVYRKRDGNGALWYVMSVGDGRWESGRIFMPLNFRAEAA